MAPLASHERLIVFADKSIDPPTEATTSYQLLALPPALLHLISSADPDGARLEIRGDPTDSAVLVTRDQTFAIRGVQNSNSLCVCASGAGGRRGRGKWFLGSSPSRGASPDQDEVVDEADEPARKKLRHEAIEIEAVLHETLEVVPGVARIDRLDSLLKGAEYRGDAEEETMDRQASTERIRVSLDSIRTRLPASDSEIASALVRKRVVSMDGYLRPLPPSFLLSILPSLLSTLPLSPDLDQSAAAAKKKDKVKGKDAKPLAPPSTTRIVHAEALEEDLLDAVDAVDCGNEDVSRQIFGWFGETVAVDGKRRWRLDAAQLVKELGVVLLADGGFGQQPSDAFLRKWEHLAGGFAPFCTLPMLAGLHLFRPPPVSTVQYLPPASLSPDPAARFAELFSLKPRWLEAEMSLYIDELTGGDKKKRDALVLKFVRKVKEKDTTWWTARNLWN